MLLGGKRYQRSIVAPHSYVAFVLTQGFFSAFVLHFLHSEVKLFLLYSVGKEGYWVSIGGKGDRMGFENSL